MSATESKSFTGINATPAPFKLKGGRYFMSCVAPAAGWGTVGLEILGQDGATYLIVPAVDAYPALSSGLFAANGAATFDCPPGQYEVVLAGFTAETAAFDTAMAAFITALGTGGSTSATYSATTHQFSGTVTGTAPTPTSTQINTLVTDLNTAMTNLVNSGISAAAIALLDTANADLVTTVGAPLTYSSVTHQFSGTLVSGPTVTTTHINTTITDYNAGLTAVIADGSFPVDVNICSVPLT